MAPPNADGVASGDVAAGSAAHALHDQQDAHHAKQISSIKPLCVWAILLRLIECMCAGAVVSLRTVRMCQTGQNAYQC